MNSCPRSHRIQILYIEDISFVVAWFLSQALEVAPSGQVYTSDFHEQRAATAR